MKKKLTVGMATFDDFEGVYFTVQSLRLNNLERLDELELLVVDNNPASAEGQATAAFCEKAGVRYLPEIAWRSTAIRDRIFREASAPFAVSVDPHVLFEPGTVNKLFKLAEGAEAEKSGDLYHGAMLYDYLDPAGKVVSHMKPEWRDRMFGTWGHDDRAKDPGAEPWEIEMHGLGCFACRVEAWKAAGGFHPLFVGFGGEEGYIHEKFRQAGGRCFVLPWLRWLHRFDRPRGFPYPLKMEERILNYLVGWLDLGRVPDDVLEHFRKTEPEIDVRGDLLHRAEDVLTAYKLDPEKTVKKWRERHPREKFETWQNTEIRLGAPIEIDAGGTRLRIARFGVEWSTGS